MSDTEPDYRFTLANERTFLAWIRTSLGLLAGAVAVVQLVPDFGSRPLRLVAGLILAALALYMAATSYVRWRRVDVAIRAGNPLPRSMMPVVMAVGISIVIVFAVVLLIRN